VGWLLSALGVFFRDIAQITTFVSLVVLYASAVFFSPTAVQATSPELWTILRWNPVLHTIDLSRQTLLWHQDFDPRTLVYTWFCGTAVFIVGWLVFRTSRPAFGDVL
jgi:lipopolysaccharide transport system permease protein